MFCRKCGKEIPDDSEFCPKCGAAIGKEILEQVNIQTDEAAVDTSDTNPTIYTPSESSINNAVNENQIVLSESKAKRSKKPIIILLTAVAVAAAIIAAIFIPMTISKNKEAHLEFEYHLLENNTYVIDGYVGTDLNVVIPDTINNLPVTEIGERAFAESNIQSISVGENVSKIEKNAFESCKNITTVDFRTSTDIKNFIIDDCAFDHCTSLENVKMPSSTTTVGKMAFNKCESLSQIDLQNVSVYGMGAFSKSGLSTVNIRSFGKYDDLGALGVFADCKKLESVYINKDVTSIPVEAFLRCTNLKEVTWSVKAGKINENAFVGCIELEIFYSADGKENKCPTDLDEYYGSERKIISSLRFNVEDGAFSGCDKFKDPEPLAPLTPVKRGSKITQVKTLPR